MQNLPSAETLQLRSLITSGGELRLSLEKVQVAPPGPDEVVVRVEASPLNPSDIGLLFGAADITSVRQMTGANGPVLIADVPPERLGTMKGRLDQALPVGNEGAGMVVLAGDSVAAQALQGRLVAVIGGAMYSQYRTIPVRDCLLLPVGTTAVDGASCFVNPLTALGMVETMRSEGHTALVHTAAASNLGVMLNRICLAEDIGLVNVVRSASQEAMLRMLGATHVCDSSAPSFQENLVKAIAATGATLAFDAIGGGSLAGQILSSMEASISPTPSYSRYGSSTHKQVYIYGGLDTGPTIFNRSFGMSYGIGGWLLFHFLARTNPKVVDRLKARIASELKTTFASHYANEISLLEVLDPKTVALFAKRATGEKYLINPSKP